MQRFLLLIGTACGILIAGGCSPSSEKFWPVSGKVTVNGERLTFGAVSFRPDAARGNGSRHHPTGVIGADGTYRLYTVGRPGAPTGWYRVLVFADENAEQGEAHPLMPQWATDAKYTREETTDLWIEVVPRPAAGAYDLRLSR
jgi:hypothetical protein